ncbi:UNVERIFIED_CONTAM: hypothetical protein Sradi_1524000 [Sesamum radiatum]|uniref:Uncharacterized protein n=1 Tax=Sesamum radiatum TaxID=300843 RepID=A0AAW2U9I9_SESRA
MAEGYIAEECLAFCSIYLRVRRVHRGLDCTLECRWVEIGREGVGVDAPLPPGGAPMKELPPEFAQILQMALQAQAQAQAQFLTQAHAPAPASHQQLLQLIIIMKESERRELQNLRVP